MLTGHIVDPLNYDMAGPVWKKLEAADEAIFTEVLKETAAKASQVIVGREATLLEDFRAKGLTINKG